MASHAHLVTDICRQHPKSSIHGMSNSQTTEVARRVRLLDDWIIRKVEGLRNPIRPLIDDFKLPYQFLGVPIILHRQAQFTRSTV